MKRNSAYIRLGIIGLICVTVLSSCRQDMHDQPRPEPYEVSNFFEDQRASRPLVEGTIARGQLRLDDHLYTGKVNGELVTTFPFAVTMDVMRRGQERFNIFCSPCHGLTGDGKGMIVQRGFRAPESYHSQRLRDMPVGHFFDVMTNGLGAMYSYEGRVSPRDRWAIAAYIRSLQLSQGATLKDLPSRDQQRIQEITAEQ